MSKTNKARKATTPMPVQAGSVITRRSGKKPNRRAKWVTYGLIVVAIAAIGVFAGLNIYKQQATKSEHNATSHQLNIVANDLHDVYLNLKAKLPNVVDSSFENECTMSYAGAYSKSYDCGSAMYLYRPNAVGNSVMEVDKILVMEQKFSHIHSMQTGASHEGVERYSYSEFLLDNISASFLCHGYSHIYNDITSLKQRTDKDFAESSFPVESISLYCTKNLTYSVDLEQSWAQ